MLVKFNDRRNVAEQARECFPDTWMRVDPRRPGPNCWKGKQFGGLKLQSVYGTYHYSWS